MSDLLKVAFQHNAWATRELITFCRRLTLAHLSTATQGARGRELNPPVAES
jgi:uncharacterized damage-inducible protein DinB